MPDDRERGHIPGMSRTFVRSSAPVNVMNNPQWAHRPNEAPRIEVDRTLKDMAEAADLIAALTAGNET